MKRCMGCMEQYRDEFSICPFCGYEENSLPEEAFHLTPGTIIGERYIVGKVLGFGGFGVTYIGFDMELEKKVAIKEYLPSEFATRTLHQTHVTVYGGDKQEQFGLGMQKFVEEARKLAKFSEDTEIVNVYDTFMENDTAYILMEYLEGESLKELLERKGKLSVEETEKLLLPVFRSLKIVHDAGIIHRDIAPDNIFVTKEGKVKLLDFGAARYASATHSRSLTVMYKPGYAPEEQYQSHGDQGPWTDVYALAATMYKCITGITPDTSLERKVHETLKEPSKLGISISKNKETALMNALNIEISARTKSTERFLEEWESKGEVARIVEKFKKMDAGKLSKKAKIGIIAGAAVLIASVAVVVGMGGVAKITDTIKIAQGNTRVPSIINETMEAAVVITQNAGIRIMQEDTRYDAEIEKGKVLAQSVEAGQLMDKEDNLLVVVSGGIRQIYVPEVSGSTREEAVAQLEKEGFQCSVEEEYSSVAIGNVTRTNYLAGARYNEGTQIIVYVSKGIDPATIEVPEEPIEYIAEDYSGMTIEEVMQQLAAYGIYLDYSEQIDSEEVEKGRIVSQRTLQGTKLTAGDTVSVVVSNGIPMLNVGNVIGWQFEGKRTELEELGFVVEEGEEVYDELSAPGLILSVVTESGENVVDEASLPKGTKLVCTISKGPKPTEASKPTKAPTSTPKPTKAPTSTPKPAKAPTLTPKPTKAPTSTPKPTKAPTSTPKPTKAPTSTPKPTKAPTSTPKPTEAPTPTPVHVHDYSYSIVTERYASCTSTGYRKHYCSCGEYSGETIPMTGHSVVVDAARDVTCTEAGLTEGKHCSVCNAVLVAQSKIPAKGHTEVIDAAKDATCTETGLTEGKHCSVCNAVLVVQNEIPAKGHAEVIDAAKAATCTETGLTEGKHCSVCNVVLVAQIEIPAKGHTEVIDAAKAATCTETGLTEGKHCSVCNAVLVAQNDTIALGHLWDNDADQYCNRCNAYRAVWHYYDQWDNNTYEDWELYKTESEIAYRDVTVTTYQYTNYYWVSSSGDYRETGWGRVPSGYTPNKWVAKTSNSLPGSMWYGTTTYGDNGNNRTSNKKYNTAGTPVLYSRAPEAATEGYNVNGLIYYEETIGSEVQKQEYTRYHYYFRKMY